MCSESSNLADVLKLRLPIKSYKAKGQSSRSRCQHDVQTMQLSRVTTADTTSSTHSHIGSYYSLLSINRTRALESAKGLLRCPIISWTFVHKRLKIGPEFSLTVTVLFVPVHRTPCAALPWCRKATLDETALGLSAAQIWSLKRC